MAESVKDKVAIVGAGCTRFGERWDMDVDDLLMEAVDEALQDAGVELKDISAMWFGYLGDDFTAGVTGGLLGNPLKSNYIPITRVENGCASGTEAVRGATYAVAAGVYDLVMAVGIEKLKDTGYAGVGTPRAGKWHPVYTAHLSPAAQYALSATSYFAKYDLSPEEGKRLLAKISVNSHHNGFLNPRAHLRREVTVEQAMNAPIIAWPLGLYDCCGVTDGAAAVILCPTRNAKSFRDDYVLIKSCSMSVGPGWGRERTDYDFTIWEETKAASQWAYKEAGIKNPRKELDMIECHDCFSVAQLIDSESMDICEPGHAKEDIDSGAWALDGEIPFNASGGLKSFGHPIGATGVRQNYEGYKQIQGKSELPERQIKNVKLGMTHNQAGTPGRFMCGITILGAP